MAISRQPEIITTDSSGEGLCEEQPSRGETRWKRFHPFKVVRKIFCRRIKRQGTEEVQESSKKSWSTSELQYIPNDENRFQDHSPPYKVGLSVSHDSIFSHDHSPVNMDPDELEELQTSSLSIPRTEMKGFRDELFTRVRARRDSDDEDVGLPHSPCTSPTTADVLSQGLKEKSTKSLNTCSAGSLLSMESLENEEDSLGQLSSGHSSRASLLDRSIGNDSDIDTSQSVPLSHEAALHKIAVRPKRTHRLPRQRRLKQLAPQNTSLPITPELTEEGRKSPLITIKKESENTVEINKELPKQDEKKDHILNIIASVHQTSHLQQKSKQTSATLPLDTKSVDGSQLMRSRSAAADLKSYQENRSRTYLSMEKMENIKDQKEISYKTSQNKGIVITVNKMETTFSVDGDVNTCQEQRIETIISDTEMEDFAQIDNKLYSENRKITTDVSNCDIHNFERKICEKDVSSSKDEKLTAYDVKSLNKETESHKISMNMTNYNLHKIKCENEESTTTIIKTGSSNIENLSSDSSQQLSGSHSVAVVTVTQSESSHLINETIKLPVLGAYGKTVIHTGGDVWSVNNVQNEPEVNQKNIGVQNQDSRASNRENLFEIVTTSNEKEISEKFETSKHFTEKIALSKEKNPVTQKRFSVEIVPFSQRIKDPNYAFSSPNKIENRFRNVDKVTSKESSIDLSTKKENLTESIVYNEKLESKHQETPLDSGKLNCPVHIRIHRGSNVESSDKIGNILNQVELTSTSVFKQNSQKETQKENSSELKKLNSFISSDEKKISSENTNDKGLNKSKKTDMKLDNSEQNKTGELLIRAQDNNTASFTTDSLSKQSLMETNCETTIMEVNVRETTQIWEKMVAAESSSIESKNKQLSRSSSTTSEEEPELLRVFARRSIKQKSDEKDITDNKTNIEDTVTVINSKILDQKESNIISTSNHSTIIKISETATPKSSDKLQSINIQKSGTERVSPIFQKVQKLDTEIKNPKSLKSEKIYSSDLKYSVETKSAGNQNIENDSPVMKDKMISIKRAPSVESCPKSAISDVKTSCQQMPSESLPEKSTTTEIINKSDDTKLKGTVLQRTPSDGRTKPPIDTKPVLHKIINDAKLKNDTDDAKIKRVPSINSESESQETETLLKATIQNTQTLCSGNKVVVTEKLKNNEKENSVAFATNRQTEPPIISTPQRWRNNKVRSHTTSEVSPSDVHKAQLRQRKASAPDLPSTIKQIDVCAKENLYSTPLHGHKPEPPPKSPSVTALVASKSPSLGNTTTENSKLKDISIASVKNNKEANLPSWLQLAQQRREQREQRERLLMGPTTTTFVLESSGKPTRNSKVWDMVHNFQKLQMT
ncbi:enolase-phosphatase E1-like [Centruroides vittatus]|uniref:enolase-phosphatase E1-like n=1 Tax=Centruroides vittatus TaxID=120091 RepID=UPI00350FE15B